MGIVAEIMAGAKDSEADSVDLDDVITDSDYTGKIIGLLYRVQNRLGSGYQEKYYQRAFAEELQEAGVSFVRERPYPIFYGEKKIGRYKVDFLVEDKLVVELKVAKDFYQRHFGQVLGYLKHSGVKLALMACFREDRVLIKRIIYSPDSG